MATVYFDPDGNVGKIVHADNAKPHDVDGLVAMAVESVPVPGLLNGRAVYPALAEQAANDKSLPQQVRDGLTEKAEAWRKLEAYRAKRLLHPVSKYIEETKADPVNREDYDAWLETK